MGTFNNEVWRIIGVFPTDDGTGKIENRIKIIVWRILGVFPTDDGTGKIENRIKIIKNTWGVPN
ncbi:unknown [Mycoplasma sp. CAG:611]|nr:unknown [Mycoplasma sp. CAG:611]